MIVEVNSNNNKKRIEKNIAPTRTTAAARTTATTATTANVRVVWKTKHAFASRLRVLMIIMILQCISSNIA